jgi:hypothetical protein
MPRNYKKQLEYQREWYKANKTKRQISHHKWDLSLKGRYHSYKKHAHTANREFSITFDEFSSIVSKPCYYCHSKEKIGIDRKDSKKGYTIDNCAASCFICNFMKKAYTEKFFINHCKTIANNF